jgi:hypothetical protein
MTDIKGCFKRKGTMYWVKNIYPYKKFPAQKDYEVRLGKSGSAEPH